MLSTMQVLDLDRKPLDILERHLGQHILIVFYNNTCLGCTGRAIPLAYEYQQEYEDLQVIGVHSDFGGEESTRADIESIFTIDIPFPIYIDPQHKLYDQVKAEGTPHWVLINKNGEIFRSFFGSLADSRNRLSYAVEAMVN